MEVETELEGAVLGITLNRPDRLNSASRGFCAGQATRFLQAFIRIGLLPDAGGTWFLPRTKAARSAGMMHAGSTGIISARDTRAPRLVSKVAKPPTGFNV